MCPDVIQIKCLFSTQFKYVKIKLLNTYGVFCKFINYLIHYITVNCNEKLNYVGIYSTNKNIICFTIYKNI